MEKLCAINCMTQKYTFHFAAAGTEKRCATWRQWWNTPPFWRQI